MSIDAKEKVKEENTERKSMYVLFLVAKVMWVDERSKFLKQQMLEEISWALELTPKEMNCERSRRVVFQREHWQ